MEPVTGTIKSWCWTRPLWLHMQDPPHPAMLWAFNAPSLQAESLDLRKSNPFKTHNPSILSVLSSHILSLNLGAAGPEQESIICIEETSFQTSVSPAIMSVGCCGENHKSHYKQTPWCKRKNSGGSHFNKQPSFITIGLTSPVTYCFHH